MSAEVDRYRALFDGITGKLEAAQRSEAVEREAEREAARQSLEAAWRMIRRLQWQVTELRHNVDLGPSDYFESAGSRSPAEVLHLTPELFDILGEGDR